MKKCKKKQCYAETLDNLDLDIILSLADNNMVVTRVAKAVFMHRNSVLYRIRRIKKLTGLDPMNFYDLHNLLISMKLISVKKERSMILYLKRGKNDD